MTYDKADIGMYSSASMFIRWLHTAPPTSCKKESGKTVIESTKSFSPLHHFTSGGAILGNEVVNDISLHSLCCVVLCCAVLYCTVLRFIISALLSREYRIEPLQDIKIHWKHSEQVSLFTTGSGYSHKLVSDGYQQKDILRKAVSFSFLSSSLSPFKLEEMTY